MNIPEIDIANCRGFESFSTPINRLEMAIHRLQTGQSEKEVVNFTFSLPRPGGAILMATVERGEFYQNIEEMPIQTFWVKHYFKRAFGLFKQLFEAGVPGLEMNVWSLTNDKGYEFEKRVIDHYHSEFVERDIGDFTLLCAEIQGNFDGQATVEYQTDIGISTNSGLTTIIDINGPDKVWCTEFDSRIHGYPTPDNDFQPWGVGVYRLLIHELGHMFGVGHFPFPRENPDISSPQDQVTHLQSQYRLISRIKPSVMNAVSLRGQAFRDKWASHDLTDDAWLVYNLSQLYEFDIGHLLSRG
jgi:hypothetical protein